MVRSHTLAMVPMPLVHPTLEPVVERLRDSGAPPQPLLLTGSKHSGKSTLARYLAGLWLCAASKEKRPCGGCAACRDVARGSGERFRVLDAEESGDVEALAQFRSLARLLPTSGIQVLLLEHADRATLPALQGLLKVLEESPASSVFLLTANQAHRLPDTLRSRCLQLAVPSVPLVRVLAYLEGKGQTRAAAQAIARSSEGLPGRLAALGDPATLASRIEAQAQVRSALAPSAEALASVPQGGIDPGLLARALTDQLRNAYGLPPRYSEEPSRTAASDPRSIAEAATGFLYDTLANRFSPRASTERLVVHLNP